MTSLAVWGGPGPAPFHAPVVVQPVVLIPVTGISDTAFRRKKRKQKYQLQQIGRPAVPVSVVSVPDSVPEPTKVDFPTLADLSGTSIESLRAEVDREIAILMRRQQEDDDEEAFTLILSALED